MAAASAILWPLLAHIALVVFLYAWLTFARAQAVQNGETDYSCFLLGRDEPLPVARITRNLANQFELPMLFYALVALLIALARVTAFDVWAAWVFVAGRLIHTYVQTRTDNVKLRGQVFMINFLAVMALAAHVAWIAFEAARG
ncbi:MAG: MAPEG family protein [Pseudorhodoplanes sp.]